jgi:hypothetical protein
VRGIKKDILTFDTPQLAAGRFIKATPSCSELVSFKKDNRFPTAGCTKIA